MNRLTAQITGRMTTYNNGDGSSHSIFGYDTNNLIIESEAKTVKRIFTLFINQRMSLNKIANELNSNHSYKTKNGGLFSPQTIKRILQRPEYCGMSFNYKKDSLVLSNVYEPIISLDEWKLAQDLYTLNKTKTNTHKNDNKSISGFPKCDICSSKYYLVKNSYVHSNDDCVMSGKSISRSIIDRYISYVVYEMINDPYICSVVFEKVKEQTDIFDTVFFDLNNEIQERLIKTNEQLNEISAQSHTKNNEKLLTKLSNSRTMLSNRLKRNTQESIPPIYSFIDYIITEWVINSKGSRLDVCNLIFTHIYITESKSIIHKLKNCDYKEKTLAECKEIISMPQKRKLTHSKVISDTQFYDFYTIGQRAIDEEERYLETQGYLIPPNMLWQYKEERNFSNSIVKFYLKDDILTSIVDSNITINMSKIFRKNNRGSYFLSYKGQSIKAKLFIKLNEVIFIRINEQVFFNRRFVNLYYSINPKLFPRDKKYINVDNFSLCFVEETNKLKCYELITEREIDVEESLRIIEDCISLELVVTE